MNKLEKPWKYKNWLIWPKTILNNMYSIDCIDSTLGVCLKNKNLFECIETCKKFCAVGYYIKLPNNTTLCIPLDDIKYKTLSPYYLLQSQNTINIKNIKISVFVNTDIFPFPPKDIGNIFFKDNIIITTDNNLNIGYNKKNIDKSPVLLNNSNLILNFLPKNTIDKDLLKFIPINFNQKLLINIPKTDIIINSVNNNLIWDKILTIFSTENSGIELIPMDKNKSNKLVLIGDIFKIKIKNKFITTTTNNKLILSENNGTIFSILSKEKGYFCRKNKCNSVEINKDTINIKNITRRPNCFNLCIKNKIIKKNNLVWLYIIIGIIIPIIIIIVLVYLF